MTGWDACIREPWAILRWIECHSGLAGYLQAVGTVAAVAVAAFAPRIAEWFQERRRKHELTVRTNLLLESLVTPTIDVGVAADSIKRQLVRFRGHPPTPTIWTEWFDSDLFLKPPLAFEFLDQRLEETDWRRTKPHREIAQSIVSYNSVHFQSKILDRMIVQNDWGNVWRELDGAIDRVRDAVTNAQLSYPARPNWDD